MKYLFRGFPILLAILVLMGCTDVNESANDANISSEASESSGELSTQGETVIFYQDKYPLTENKQLDDIYGAYLDIEASYACDVSYPSIIQESELIVLCKVIAQDGVYLGYNWPVPNTSYVVEIEEIYKGECKQKEIKVATKGGFLPISQYMEHQEKSIVEKQGLDKLSAEEQESKLLAIFPGDYQTIEVNESYIFFLNQITEDGRVYNEDDYWVSGEGYGVFHYEKDRDSFYSGANEIYLSTDKLKQEIGSGS